MGATGSGKTTLAYLLARLYDVDSGAICYDGVDLRDLSFDGLSSVLGVVTQDPYLFHDTIAANLGFAHPEATGEETPGPESRIEKPALRGPALRARSVALP